MACLLFCSFFIFLCWAEGTKELNKNDAAECRDAVSPILCGEPAGKNCLDDSCYTFNTTKRTWPESRKECKKNGGDLVSIETKKELVFLQKRLQDLHFVGHTRWFIGLSVEDSAWEWESGKPLTYNRWRGFIHPDYNGQFVAMVVKNAGEWTSYFEDTPGKKSLHFSICEIPYVGKVVDTYNWGNQSCQGKSCYILDQTLRSWEENKKECIKKGGNLVSLETECEWYYVSIFAGNRNPNAVWHVGLKRKPMTSWKWVNNVPYTLGKDLWRKSQPRGKTSYTFMTIASSNKNPVMVFRDPDHKCEEHSYICEKKIEYKPPTK